MNRDPALSRTEGKLADRALVLTIATLVLLTPPILEIFNVPVLFFGVPLLHIYSFGVWFAAIACGGWLAAHMNAGDGEVAADTEPAERN